MIKISKSQVGQLTIKVQEELTEVTTWFNQASQQ
jgi:hypothetical protein